VDEATNERHSIVDEQSLGGVGDLVKIVPAARRSPHDWRGRRGPAGTGLVVKEPFQKSEMLFERSPSIGRGRGTATEDRGHRSAICCYDLQRELATHEGFGVRAEQLVNAAPSGWRQKDAAAVRLMGKDGRSGEPPRASDGLDSAKFGALAPALLAQSFTVFRVELDRRFAATGGAMVAVPLFEDRQGAQIQRHVSSNRQDRGPTKRRDDDSC
jgi:hypothetical protein